MLVQPTGKVVALQTRQSAKLTLLQVVKTVIAFAESLTGPLLATAATAAERVRTVDETKAALRRAKRAMNLTMVKKGKAELTGFSWGITWSSIGLL